jgi:hypothetical protein
MSRPTLPVEAYDRPRRVDLPAAISTKESEEECTHLGATPTVLATYLTVAGPRIGELHECGVCTDPRIRNRSKSR